MESLDYIDSYFKGELTPEEVRQFELRIEQDPVFAHDVAFYVSASGILKEQSDSITRERFVELEQLHSVKTKRTPVLKMTLSIAAAAISIGLVIGIFLWQPSSPQSLADEYIREEMVLDRNETMGVNVDSMRLATEYFNKGNYVAALPLFEGFSRNHPDNDEARLNTGITALKIGDYQKAIYYFGTHEKVDLYANPAKFYHAVALLKRNQQGDKAEAKVLLEQIVKQNLDKKDKASEWLKRM
jgi:tetratricopeptide (TPR) repeat protein